ncbi:MAG: AraC family ligand binding domain-containing protein [Blautia sp.]
MESCFYETIHETDLLHVRFELQDAPAFVFPAHWHEYVEILYLIRGQFSAIVQATEYRLNEGDLIIINSGDLHMTRSNTCTYLLLQISASQMRQYLPDFDTMRFDTIIPCSEQPAPLRALLSEMNEIRQNPSDSYQLLFTSRLYEFLYHLCRSYSHQIPSASLTGSQRDLQRVTHVMNWVKVHYPEPLSLETAADSLALSKEYFCRLFKKYTGQTFLEYLNDVRTMHLYEDLQNSDETITVLMEKKRAVELQNFYADLQKAVWLYTSENALEPDTARINSFETYCSYTH